MAHKEVPAMTLAGERPIWITGLDAIAFKTSERNVAIWDYRRSTALTQTPVALKMLRIV